MVKNIKWDKKEHNLTFFGSQFVGWLEATCQPHVLYWYSYYLYWCWLTFESTSSAPCISLSLSPLFLQLWFKSMLCHKTSHRAVSSLSDAFLHHSTISSFPTLPVHLTLKHLSLYHISNTCSFLFSGDQLFL